MVSLTYKSNSVAPDLEGDIYENRYYDMVSI